MNRRSKTLLIVGAITVIITAIISTLCIKDWHGLIPLAVACLIWAEFIVFGGLLLVEKLAAQTEQVFLRASFMTLLSAYSILVFFLSIIFMIGFKDALTTFVILQLAAFAAFTVLLIISFTASKGVNRTHQSTMYAVSQVNAFVSRLHILAASEHHQEYASLLKKMAENLRFTDSSSIAAVDTEIDKVISEIESELAKKNTAPSMELVQQKLAELNSFIAERKIEISIMKKGRL